LHVDEKTIDVVCEAGRAKAALLRERPLQYFVLATLAGAYIGFGVMLIFAIGAPLQAVAAASTKAVMGASFGVALALVIFAGSELFTGNNLVMAVATLSGKASTGSTTKVWAASFVGNLVGSLFLAALVVQSGLMKKGPVSAFIQQAASAKMNAPWMELFVRGMLCNTLVCLAVWMGYRVKDETAKLLLICWCLFAFVGAGFEHCVANMTLMAMALFSAHAPDVSWAGYVRNLVPVTLGNLVGGAVFVGAAYWFVAKGAPSVAVPSEAKAGEAKARIAA
jgi:nitrite transporter